MQARIVKTILRKELLDILRDRRTLFVMIVLPILVYPLLLIGFSQVAMMQVARIAGRKSQVTIVGGEWGGRLTAMLDTLANVEKQPANDWEKRIRDGKLDAALAIPEGFWDSVKTERVLPLALYYNSSKEVSLKAKRRLEDVLQSFREGVVAERLQSLAADTSLLHPFRLNAENLATLEQRQGDALGKFLGYLMIMMMVAGAFYPAVDLTAGEKERGTLETLLVSPASRADIVYGKFFAVMVVALLTALLNLLSLGLTAMYLMRVLGEAAEVLPGIAVSPLSLVLTLLLLIPLAVLFAALCLAVAVGARNFKEGQNLLTPVYVIVIAPAMVSFIPGTEMSVGLALIPVANVSLLIREYLMGNYLWRESLVAFSVSWGLAAAALWWATDQFKQESVLFRHAEELRWSPLRLFRRRSAAAASAVPSPANALLLLAAMVILLFALGNEAARMGVIRSLLLTQALVLVLPLVYAARSRCDLRLTYSLRRPRAAAWPATVVMICGGWLIGIELASLQNWISPFPEEFLKRFTDFFAELNRLPLATGLLLVAALPAVGEELLCRGFVLSSFGLRFGKTGAVVLTAVAFGLLHLDPYRLTATIFLGILLGIIVVWTGSIYPAMLGHALNNALSYLVQRYQDTITAMAWFDLDSMQTLPLWLVAVGIALVAAGLVWMRKIEPLALSAPRAGEN